MEIKRPKTDVGVLVARFQLADLHEAHLKLIQGVVDNHEKVIVYLGVAQMRVTGENPLDFEARKQMILEKFPSVNVLYIKDVGDNKKWASNLDGMIQDIIGPHSTVCLYGGRDSFIDRYPGKFQTCELEQVKFVSGTAERARISKKVMSSSQFRAGVIWAVENQYPRVSPTVDIAIWHKDHNKLLMGRKPKEDLFRFIGGFVDGKTSLEEDAIREVKEEASIEISRPIYIGSFPVKDWRLTGKDAIVTAFFEATHMSCTPKPDDDIVALHWFEVNKIKYSDIVEAHKPLLEMIGKKYPKKFISL